MSTDNGVYILKTKEGHYRVALIQGIGALLETDLTPKVIRKLWKNCNFTKNQITAYEIAYKIANSLPFCEYGVQLVTYDMSWHDIKVEAQKNPKPTSILDKVLGKIFPEDVNSEEW